MQKLKFLPLAATVILSMLFISCSNAPTDEPYDFSFGYSQDELGLEIASETTIQDMDIDPRRPPRGFKSLGELGIITHEKITVQRLHAMPEPWTYAEEPRSIKTPGGDYLVVYPAGRGHTIGKEYKANDMFYVRSSDLGKTWSKPQLIWEVDYNQHGFNPVIPKGSSRIYTFGQEAPFGTIIQPHSGPLGMRYSDDDGHTWTEPIPIQPTNDPDYKGVCHMQMCETDSGAWIMGTYLIRTKTSGKRLDRQFVLRSENRGETWKLLPNASPDYSKTGVKRLPNSPDGWFLPEYDRLLEGQAIYLGNDKVVLFMRSEEGHVWETRSNDDGRTWSDPKATPLVHPDAPPMIYKLADGKTLLAFIHNKKSGGPFRMYDRTELWLSLSKDGGVNWTEPRFIMTNIAVSTAKTNTEISYGDLLVEGDDLHFFFDHKKRQIFHAQFKASDIEHFPTETELRKIVSK